MDSAQTWVEALNISPEKLSEWGEKAPEGVPLLVYALDQGLIPLKEYMDWASNHYGLPILDSKFFEGFDREKLAAERSNWAAWCFPVSVWEDVTYVACVEPPSETPDGKFAFILADPHAMIEAWGQTKLTETNVPGPLDAPEGINLNAPSTGFVLNLDSNVLASPDAPTETVEVEVPPPPPKAQPAAAKTAAPEKLGLVVKPAPAAAAPKPAPAAAAAPAKPAPAAVKVSEDVEIRSAFDRLKATYTMAMVMKCDESKVRPYRWSEDLQVPQNLEDATVNLTYPSFFRIVAKTQQPYHGFIIDSPVHRNFFTSLKFDDLPACVTAIPLKADNNLWGMLVAIGPESAQSPEALDNAARIGEKLTKALEPAWSSGAA